MLTGQSGVEESLGLAAERQQPTGDVARLAEQRGHFFRVGLGRIVNKPLREAKHTHEALHARAATASIGDDDKRLPEYYAEDRAMEGVSDDALGIAKATEPLLNLGKTNLARQAVEI